MLAARTPPQGPALRLPRGRRQPSGAPATRARPPAPAALPRLVCVPGPRATLRSTASPGSPTHFRVTNHEAMSTFVHLFFFFHRITSLGKRLIYSLVHTASCRPKGVRGGGQLGSGTGQGA